ncbi:hypothetical protein ACFL35_06700 [Candidatus Riflebacteria bacterium]
MRISMSLFLFILLISCSRATQSTKNSFNADLDRVVGQKTVDKETISLANEYKNLRKQPSHWKGGKWNDDIDKFGERMNIVLREPGKRLGNTGSTKSQLIELMGEPDAGRQEDDRELLIYFWRGWHDYLYFICKEGNIQKAKWYFAYE